MSDSEWKSDVDAALVHYPKLRIEGGLSARTLVGIIDVVDKDEDFPIGSFEVKIQYPPAYPKRLPRVWEIGGRIPHDINRHLFPKDWNMCFMFPAEEEAYCWTGISTLRFLNQVLVPRLADEYNVSSGGKYRSEYSHDPTEAAWQFYEKKFNTVDKSVIERLLQALTCGSLPKGFEACPCGSGLKFKKCHRLAVQPLVHAVDSNKRAYQRMFNP